MGQYQILERTDRAAEIAALNLRLQELEKSRGEYVEVGEYPAAPPTVRRYKELALLRVRTSYYSEAERYQVAKAMFFTDWIVKEEKDEKTGQVTIEMKPPDLSPAEFFVECAKVLFPTAPIRGNEDHVDPKAAWKAVQEFFTGLE